MRCTKCHLSACIRKGVRRGKIKYVCKNCGKWFQVNRGERKHKGEILISHLYGLSFRSIAQRFYISPATSYRRCMEALSCIPQCIDVTRSLCNRFCGILLVDGKYVAVRGYERKIPAIYGVDYLTHDIPHYTFSVAENYQTCIAFFQSLRLANYPLQAVVCDDNPNIYQAATKVYPRAVIQLCQNHYKQGIRQNLNLRDNPQYLPFMRSIEKLFETKRSKEDFEKMAGKIVISHKEDPRCLEIMADIFRRLSVLNGYLNLKRVPKTTNLIESFNSHLQGRLKTIKGFDSFRHADFWLNGYFMQRRLKPFTDCLGAFRRLNGKCSLEETMVDLNKLPDLLSLFR